MKFKPAERNPLGDILELFTVESQKLDSSLLDKFRVLLKDAGFICENDMETSRCLDFLEELELVKIENKKDGYYIKRIING